MRRGLLALGLLLLGGCGGKAATIPAGSRLIMQGNSPLYAICDRGNLLYVTESGGVQIVPLGCLTGSP